MNQPKVCIITLNWNGLEDTIECLESLKKITYPNYEVIVVDNGSEGNDAQVLEEKFGDYTHLIKNDKNYGYCGGNNMAMRYALNNSNPDYLLLLNNDTVVDPEFLSEMVKVAETDPAIGITSAKFYYYDEPNQLQFVWGKVDLWRGERVWRPGGMADKIKKIEIDRGQYDSIKEVSFVTGWCELIKRKSLEHIGLLDERYFFDWEEGDYCIRAKKAGYKIVYVPKAKVWHKWRSIKKLDGFLQYFGTKTRFQLVRQHGTKWQYRFFQIYFFGIYFWLATAYYLVFLHSLKVLLSFYKAAREELFHSGANT